MTTPRKKPAKTGPFKSNDEMLEMAARMLQLRKKDQDTSLVNAWHAQLSATPTSVTLAECMQKKRLTRLEREILAVVLLGHLGLHGFSSSNIQEVLENLAIPVNKQLTAIRALMPNGRLSKNKLIYVGELDDDYLPSTSIVVAQRVAHAVVLGVGRNADNSFHASDEEEMRAKLLRLTSVSARKADILSDIMRGYLGRKESSFLAVKQRQEMFLDEIDNILDHSPDWHLTRVRAEVHGLRANWIIMLTLLGKTLNHLEPGDDVFTGAGLCRAVATSQEDLYALYKRLDADAPLIKKGYIQPCDGTEGLLSGDAESLRRTPFELTEKSLRLFGIGDRVTPISRRDTTLLEPQIRLADMVLPGSTMDSVRMALDHVRHAGKIMDQWGLRKAFPYGTGATLLFYGPPGTGKTATAEAIAGELGKRLYVADYSKIQNCFVGQTEKNIVATFRAAQRTGAVLFWDEADAMFFDRESASRTWEVRAINVLLQEIERFEGVCILATNRKATLDKAMERRITAKVEFPRPDRNLREGIWRSLLPKDLPLATDVDVSRLAAMDLAGGEIKNVILNAARMACGRSGDDRVTGQDFERALELETRNRWGESSRKRAGFCLA